MTEWHASDYHRQSGLQQAMAEEQLGLLTLEGGERILEVEFGGDASANSNLIAGSVRKLEAGE